MFDSNIIYLIVEYKPTHAPIIRSFYKYNKNKYKQFLNKIDESDFFIEEFIRLFNDSYDFVDKSRIKITEVDNDKEIEYINYYLEKYNNIFDIIGHIYDTFENDEDILSIDDNIDDNDSDQDLTDSVNISNILDCATKNNINFDNIDDTKITIKEDQIAWTSDKQYKFANLKDASKGGASSWKALQWLDMTDGKYNS